MARRARDSVGWMPGRMGRLSAGVRRGYPVTLCKESLIAKSMRRVWALRHHIGLYSAVECSRTKVAVRNIVAPALQPQPASRLKSATRDASFLQSDSRCGDTWATCPVLLRGIWIQSRRARVSLLELIFNSSLAFLLLKWKAADTVCVVLSFSFQV